MSLALHLPKNVDSVIVTQCPGHLVVVHRQMIFLYAPKFGQTWRIDNLEHTHLLIFPCYEAGETLMGIVQ